MMQGYVPRVVTLFVMAALVAALALPLTAFAQDWTVLDCGTGDPPEDENPDGVDLVGDLTGGNNFWTAAVDYDQSDAGYLYFAVRVNGDPSGPHGFAQYAWTALIQIPSATTYDPFQYQYIVSLNGIGPGGGDNDTVELWFNDPAENIDWSPIFNDPAETQLWRHDYATGGPFAGSLAAYELATSNIDGDPDYLVTWAIPISELIAHGVIGGWQDLGDAHFFPATATNANNYNKDRIDGCPFGPGGLLAIDKTVTPSLVGHATPASHDVLYTLVVTNIGSANLTGLVVEDNDLAACMTVTGMTSSAGIVQTMNPPLLTVNNFQVGNSVTILVTVDASACNVGTFPNHADVYATNAPEVGDDATLVIEPGLGVLLADFTAWLEGDHILVTWETVAELETLGFNLYRSAEASGQELRLNDTLIPAQGPGSSQGFTYTWSDANGLVAGMAYDYWLEDIDFNGTTTRHGPVRVVFENPTVVGLTAIDAAPVTVDVLPLLGLGLAVLAALWLLGHRHARV